MKITFLGLTITSSWDNGHATTYRSLLQALHRRGHQVTFLEKDVESYSSHRDLHAAPWCDIILYDCWRTKGRSLALRHARESDVVVIGSCFPDAIAASHALLDICSTPIFFYDLDTPVTLARLRSCGLTDYLDGELIPFFAACMSATGGPALRELMDTYGSPLALPFYCSVDPALHRRTAPRHAFACDLAYLGACTSDRQLSLDQFLQQPARLLPASRFLVAGSQYPGTIEWAPNVNRMAHIPRADHPALYSSARFTLNITGADTITAGYLPCASLLEAAACGAAIVSDSWPGLETFFQPGEEILLPESAEEVVAILTGMSDAQARRIGRRSAGACSLRAFLRSPRTGV